MTGENQTKEDSSSIVVPRTAAIEAQLQKLWRSRPEYEGMIPATVSAALAALIREVEMGRHNGAIGFNPDEEWN